VRANRPQGKYDAMSKNTPPEDELRPEYDFSSGVRGKYAKRFAEGSNVVVLEPDVAERFPNSEAVNRALRRLISEMVTSVKKDE
jgi:hypothetical protein